MNSGLILAPTAPTGEAVAGFKASGCGYFMIVRIANFVLTLAGGLALLTGLLFWAGIALNLISMHMMLGFLAVAALWFVALGQAAARGGSWLLALSALIVGGIAIYIGLYQASMLVGAYHWIVEIVHLLLGILIIALGHMAAARHQRNRRTAEDGAAQPRKPG